MDAEELLNYLARQEIDLIVMIDKVSYDLEVLLSVQDRATRVISGSLELMIRHNAQSLTLDSCVILHKKWKVLADR